jgi:hypothetical protein
MPFRITVKGSARSTTSPSRCACCSARGLERVAIVDSRRPPRQRHGVHLRIRSALLFTFLDAPAAQLADVEARAGRSDIGLARRRRARRRLPRRARARLPAVMAHRPQCVFYLAGADP